MTRQCSETWKSSKPFPLTQATLLCIATHVRAEPSAVGLEWPQKGDIPSELGWDIWELSFKDGVLKSVAISNCP